MRKRFSALLFTTMLLGLSACGSTVQPSSSATAASVSSSTASAQVTAASSTAPESSAAQVSSAASPSSAPSTPDPQVKPSTETTKTLVVYFSMPETTKADNLTTEEENSVVVMNGEVLGNTQYVAYVIAENTGADLFRIEAKTPYTIDHEALVNLAKEEQNQNARPELSKTLENLNRYDTVFIGYPNWWGDMPMILYTFFDENDFSGKTIIPFNTHGGSGFSNTIGTIAALEPDADVNQEGFTVSRNVVQEAEPDIISWLDKLGY